MRIFLIGFMGCGKTTLAKKLAAKLGYSLVDLDHELEKLAGTTVAAYFAAHGEDRFRQFEQDTLKGFAYPEHCVVATGGGTPCFFDNMDWMKANGTTVYIEMSAASLAKRLEKGRHKRPLLRNLTGDDLVAFIEDKLAGRTAFYSRAEKTVSGISLNADLLQALLLPETD